MTVQHILAGQSIDPPKNDNEITIETNLDGIDSIGNLLFVSVNKIQFQEKANQILRDYFQNATSGNGSVFQGIPYDITITEGNISQTIKLLVNLKNAEFDRDLTTADVIIRTELDWANLTFDGVTFQTLFSMGKISTSDYIFIPYIINSIPNTSQTFIAILSLTYITLQLQDVIQDLETYAAAAPTGVDSPIAAIGLVNKVIYLIILLAAVVKLILDLIRLIIQKVKYKPSMRIKKLLEIGCQHFGLTLQTSFFDGINENLMIIPRSLSNPNEFSENQIFGFTSPNTAEQSGYPDYSFGELLRRVNTYFNARVVIKDGILKILPKVWQPTGASFQIQPIYNPKFTLNAERLVANINITFQYDPTDKNTINEWKGTNVDVHIRPAQNINQQLNLLSGSKFVTIQFARAFEKTDLTFPEKVIDVLLDIADGIVSGLISVVNGIINIINTIINVINGINDALGIIGLEIPFDVPTVPTVNYPNWSNLIDNRIGMMVLETDFTTVDKIALISVGESSVKNKIHPFNLVVNNAKNIYLTRYKLDNYQAKIINYDKVEMNLFNFTSVLNEQALKLANGTPVKVLRCKWNKNDNIADVEIEQPFIYAPNMIEIITEPKGR